MREPEVLYCTSADGTRIAYWVLGNGPTILNVASWADNPELIWEDPESRASLERLGHGHRYVTAIRRGSAASQRDVTDLSLDAQIGDVAAVADHLGAECTDILASPDASPVVVAYAARYPEKVRRLILWAPFAYGPTAHPPGQMQQILELVRSDWSIARRMLAAIIFPNGPVDAQRRWSALWRESISPETAAKYVEWLAAVDVRDQLPLVRAPTLAISRRNMRFPPMSESRPVATLIPDCRFLPLDGDIGHALHGDTSWIDTALEFLDEGRQPAIASGITVAPAALQTILFTDVEGSTALTDRLGDAAARDVMREHERITREALKAHGGSEVKTMGDGFMASFGSATKALECAVAIQKAFAEPETTVGAHHDAPLRPEDGIKVRIGLNAGEPIAEDDPDGRSDLFGTAVIVAARIAAQAHGGEVLVSDVVRQLVAGKNFLFNDRGEQTLKGFEDPVRVFEVRWTDVDS